MNDRIKISIIFLVPKHSRQSSLPKTPGQYLTRDALLEHIRALPHGRATYKQLVKELRDAREDRDVLEGALDRLADSGSLCGTAVRPLHRQLAAIPSISPAGSPFIAMDSAF